jgi:hypothetical protein
MTTHQERCPCCGTPVRVVSSGEGTNHYEPIGGMIEMDRIAQLEKSLSRLIASAQPHTESHICMVPALEIKCATELLTETVEGKARLRVAIKQERGE